MKWFSLFSLVILLSACNSGTQPGEVQRLQSRIDSLERKLDQTYKPGFGEFMSSIQVHHAKLWFAGINGNWKLADFEMKEIREALDNIPIYNIDRPEIKELGMILPPMDSVDQSIKKQDIPTFKDSYTRLTATCNKCHQVTEHGFNVVTEPVNPPVYNQLFGPVK